MKIGIEIERAGRFYIASAVEVAYPFRRIASCEHRHPSAADARTCTSATRRRAQRILRQQLASKG
jgi:hypothetical protein